MGLENRGHSRKRSFIGAKIVFNNGRGVFDCIVKDLSDGGAKRVSDATSSVPDEFELRLSDGRIFRCLIKWRKLGTAGVQFI